MNGICMRYVHIYIWQIHFELPTYNCVAFPVKQAFVVAIKMAAYVITKQCMV